MVESDEHDSANSESQDERKVAVSSIHTMLCYSNLCYASILYAPLTIPTSFIFEGQEEHMQQAQKGG